MNWPLVVTICAVCALGVTATVDFEGTIFEWTPIVLGSVLLHTIAICLISLVI
jgi:hypothetical protein